MLRQVTARGIFIEDAVESRSGWTGCRITDVSVTRVHDESLATSSFKRRSPDVRREFPPPYPLRVKQMDIVANHSAMSDAPFGTEPNSPLVNRNFSSACVVCRSSGPIAWSTKAALYRPVLGRGIEARAYPQLITVQSSLFQLVTVIVRHCYPYVESLQHDPQYDPTTRLTRPLAGREIFLLETAKSKVF
jgi:hypothetical protein